MGIVEPCRIRLRRKKRREVEPLVKGKEVGLVGVGAIIVKLPGMREIRG